MTNERAWAERALRGWLQFAGVVCASAMVAVVMPLPWHAIIHDWLGLGELPDAPLVEYLARGMSAMCSFYGLLLIWLARDVRRYAELIRFQTLILMVISLCSTLALWNSGMPPWWIYGDAGSVWTSGLITLWLLRCLR
ncbi:MAG TPA: hypothetical protein VL096_08190 [Pirellulaceae bacterium]|nr:hypothetical protein [Pirellulaceae bacterium]